MLHLERKETIISSLFSSVFVSIYGAELTLLMLSACLVNVSKENEKLRPINSLDWKMENRIWTLQCFHIEQRKARDPDFKI